MYKDTVTVFNRRTESGKVLWYPTVIEGAHVDKTDAAGPGRYGWTQGGRAAVLIPYFRAEGAPTVAGKLYLPPRLWRRVETPEMYVTFAPGDEFDFFITGAWDGAAPVDDGQWPGGFYDGLCRERDDVYAVAAVCRYDALPHFEVTGR